MQKKTNTSARQSRSIVLIIPNSRWFGKRKWLSLPYSALILSAILRPRFDFSIIDANAGDLTQKEVQEAVKKAAPAVAMITAGSVEYHKQAHAAAAAARTAVPQAAIVMGGIYPTVLPEEAGRDSNVDWLFLYHAEERIASFLELVLAGEDAKLRQFPGIAFRDGDGRVIDTKLTEHIGNVKVMVKPDYSLLDVRPYLDQNSLDYQFNSSRPTAFLITSYGCPYNCVFCAARTISGRRTVFRPVEDVLEEIDFLVREYGIGNLIFTDDALLQNRPRVEKLLAGLIKRGSKLDWKAATVAAWQLDDNLLELMKKSGCKQITISIESGSQRVLTEVIKKPLKLSIIPPIVRKCRELEIDCGANFVIGLPGETWEDIRQTFQFAEECDLDVAHFHIATPLPKTDLYRICKEQGYLPADFSFLDPNFFGYANGFITTPEFTPLELAIVRAYEWDRINFFTPERAARVARLYCSTPERLREHRKFTRRRLGLHVEGMDDSALASARQRLLQDAAKSLAKQ